MSQDQRQPDVVYRNRDEGLDDWTFRSQLTKARKGETADELTITKRVMGMCGDSYHRIYITRAVPAQAEPHGEIGQVRFFRKGNQIFVVVP